MTTELAGRCVAGDPQQLATTHDGLLMSPATLLTPVRHPGAAARSRPKSCGLGFPFRGRLFIEPSGSSGYQSADARDLGRKVIGKWSIRSPSRALVTSWSMLSSFYAKTKLAVPLDNYDRRCIRVRTDGKTRRKWTVVAECIV